MTDLGKIMKKRDLGKEKKKYKVKKQGVVVVFVMTVCVHVCVRESGDFWFQLSALNGVACKYTHTHSYKTHTKLNYQQCCLVFKERRKIYIFDMTKVV